MFRLDYRFHRVRGRERMDAPGLAAEERLAALRGLDRLSRWPGQGAPILRGLAALLGRPQGRTRRVLEVGAGSGRLSGWLGARLRAMGHAVEIVASDREGSEGVLPLDAVRGDLPEADIYFSNLLLHHLEDADAVAMLRRQAAVSRLGVLHFDVQRHWAHYYGARFLLRAARMPDIVLHDGALSIQQGFTRGELRGLAQQAGLRARVAWQCPFRWMLAWRRP